MDVDEFVSGLRVLAVDDDRVSLMLISKQLQLCKYNVTTVMDPEMALEMLRARRDADDQFDIVITDVHMPGMDGFKLLELIGLEMDIPVIMLSANDTFETMLKGIQHGARDYLVKPVRTDQLKQLWKHAVKKITDDPSNCINNNSNGSDEGQSENGENNDNHTNTKKTCSTTKKKRHGDIAREDKDNASARKKQRIQWSGALHRKFVQVVNQLGLDKAVPKKILEMMNVEGLTREHVASHLQKYRLYLKKLSEGTYRNSSPFTDEALWDQGNSINTNGQEHVEHNLENGIYKPSLSFAGSSSSSNPFARMNSPAAFGRHCLLPTQSVQLMTQRNVGIPFKDMGPVGYGGNMTQVAVPGSQQGLSSFTSAGSFNRNICFPSVTNMSNSMPFNTFASGTSSNSFANIQNGSSQSDPFKTYANLFCGRFGEDNSVENTGDGEMLPPSSNTLPMQHPESAAPFGVNGSIISGKTVVPFGLMVASAPSEAGPSQRNRHLINRLSRFAASSGQSSEFQNQMASLARAATPIAGFSNEQVAPLFNIGNTTAMMNDDSATGGTSSAVSTLPNFQMNNPVMMSQTLNGGGEGGSLPEKGDIAGDQQQSTGDQLNNNNVSVAATSTAHNGTDNAVDDFYADWLNPGVLRNDGTFMAEDWEFTP